MSDSVPGPGVYVNFWTSEAGIEQVEICAGEQRLWVGPLKEILDSSFFERCLVGAIERALKKGIPLYLFGQRKKGNQ